MSTPRDILPGLDAGSILPSSCTARPARAGVDGLRQARQPPPRAAARQPRPGDRRPTPGADSLLKRMAGPRDVPEPLGRFRGSTRNVPERPGRFLPSRRAVPERPGRSRGLPRAVPERLARFGGLPNHDQERLGHDRGFAENVLRLLDDFGDLPESSRSVLDGFRICRNPSGASWTFLGIRGSRPRASWPGSRICRKRPGASGTPSENPQNRDRPVRE